MKNKNIIWEPQPKQIDFMARPEYEVLYGGAAGGGKSDALLIEALRQVKIPHYRAIIFRKTYPQVSELESRSEELYKKIYPGCKYNSSKHFWKFKSGARIYFGAMQHTKDRINYQGKRYDFVAFDELTHFTWDEYSYMFSRNRPSGPGTRVYLRATTNPGGVGHGWVKERFITAAPPLTPIESVMEVVTPEGETVKLKRKRVFVPSSVFDNKKLLENDPNYIANLAMLPEAERNALLYGDWDSFSGQVFSEFKDNPKGYESGVNTHVINAFPIPDSWQRYISFDFGFSHPYSVGFWAVSPKGRLYRYHEIYGCVPNSPNTGVKLPPDMIAKKIKEYMDFERQKLGIPNLHYRAVADPAIWDDRYGSDASPQKIMQKFGIYFEKGNHDRLAGKMQIHYRLEFDENGYPGMYIFKNCKDFIRTIPNLVYDDHNVEDINTDGEDHIYDETRYFLMMNPVPVEKRAKKKKPAFNPLDM